MSRREIQNRHFFHMVDKSPWPLLVSICALLLTLGALVWFNQKNNFFVLFALISIIFLSSLWFRDVIREGTIEGHHTFEVQTNLRLGMILFIVSEIMFFFSFFWTFFHSSLSPAIQIGGIWPPMEIQVLNTFEVPALNTLILITSGSAVTWAHYAMIKNDRNEVIMGFVATLFLAILFTAFQVIEYLNSKYYLVDGVYGSIFFLITGFHGLHVIIGSIFLIVCFLRYLFYHFTPKHHIGFQAAAWYWHFVDVVWILLFFSIYFWGNYINIDLISDKSIEINQKTQEIEILKDVLFFFFMKRSFHEKKRLVKSNVILSIIDKSLVSYPCPINLNYFWNFGVLSAIFLGIQIITGIFLAMHYIPSADLAFFSVEHIMRDVNNGWLLRYTHANGASMFFLIVYIHMFRGLYFGSFLHPREFLWLTGCIILLLMIITAFLGYVLPWGQMSFWAATVITNLASAIPFVGDSIVLWLWGGFAVDHATLNRFYSLHYLLPFVIAALALLHIIFLHERGSNNPLGIPSKVDQIPFNPFFTIKDFYSFCLVLFVFIFFVAFYPNLLGHSDNYIPANPLVTPTHIVPEWYFLPFYAMLRSIPNKLLGVMTLASSIIVLMLMPFIFYKYPITRSFVYTPFYRISFFFFFFNSLILGFIGGKSVETPFYELGQFSTIFYFFYFIVLFFFVGFYNFNRSYEK